MLRHFKSRLARRIAFASIVISILSGLFIGGISAVGEFRRSLAIAYDNNARLIGAAVPQIESAYWDLDLGAVQATLDRLAETPMVHRLEVHDLVFTQGQLSSVAIGTLAASSDRPTEPVWPMSRLVPQKWLSSQIDLPLRGRDTVEPIATLKVELNSAGLYDELGYRTMNIVATTVLQSLLIAGLLFWLVRAQIIAPLDQLARAARSHRETGRFQTEGLQLADDYDSTEDEIRTLGRDFSRTVLRMERYRDHLREEVEQRTAELVVARNDALAASRAKSVFLANMSHELRTPLNAITGLSDLLLAEGQDPTTRRYIADMRFAARQLLGSIDHVLDLSKLEMGHMVYSIVAFRPEDVLDEVIAQTRALAARKPIAIEADIDPAIYPVLLGDAQKITQVLLNLTSNAVKFTIEGRIRLGLHRRGRHLRITVADTGTGIPTDQLADVFTPFMQVDDSASRDQSGTGLGLPIARQMAEGMGGRLRLASRAGKGSLFVLTLPLRDAEEPKPMRDWARVHLYLPAGPLRRRLAHMLTRLGFDPKVADKDVAPAAVESGAIQIGFAGAYLTLSKGDTRLDLPMVLTHRELLDALRTLARPQDSEPVLGAVDLIGTHILLIEDRDINRMMVEALLRRFGARVTPVASGRQALAISAQIKPDLILTDLHMPHMDGFATIEALRRNGLGDVPVVALSADVSTQTRDACREAGFEGFVAKPLTATVLHQELRRILLPATEGRRPADAPPVTANPSLSPPPAILDQALLLYQAGGDRALVQQWCARLPDEIASWRKLLAEQGPNAQVLHIIRGCALQLGATQLALCCQTEPADISALHDAIGNLEAALPQPEVPPPANPPHQILDLTAIRAALARNEMRGFDLLEALLPKMSLSDAAAFSQAAQDLDFRQALILIDRGIG